MRQIVEDKKGMDIRLLDVRGQSSLTDYTLIVSGSSPPHLKALYNDVVRLLKKNGVQCFRKAGDPESGWLVVDYVDVVVHILSKESREYYALEELWPKAKTL